MLGWSDVVFSICLHVSKQTYNLFESFRSHLMTLAEVISIYHTGGENDFLVHVAVRDADHLRDLASLARRGILLLVLVAPGTFTRKSTQAMHIPVPSSLG